MPGRSPVSLRTDQMVSKTFDGSIPFILWHFETPFASECTDRHQTVRPRSIIIFTFDKPFCDGALFRLSYPASSTVEISKHPFIITLHYAFQTPDHLYMILDYCPGGDLSFHIARNLFEEEEAKFFIAELILAIEHVHSMDIIYRDLKPENILIDKDGHLKLCDFGLAKENITGNKMSSTFCGSLLYMAPEALDKRGAGKSSDIYSIGAVLYTLISGTPPFYANDINKLYKKITKNNLMLHDYFSEELKDLLKVL